MNKVILQPEPFKPWEVLSDFERDYMKGTATHGATASFVGTMRDLNEGDDVTSMCLEHYAGMTEKIMHKVVEDANQHWSLLSTLLLHRVGHIYPSEPIVLVATWSQHRKAAFESCRFMMEELKSSVPFWKKEVLLDGSERWVDKNTKGY